MLDQLRRARTEALFRDVNERIAETAHRFASESAEFVCECGDPTCAQRVEAGLHEYHEVREDGTQFLLAHGHEDPEIEKVVERTPRFTVVAKVRSKLIAETVRRLDPRAEAV